MMDEKGNLDRLIEDHLSLVPRAISPLGRAFPHCWDDLVGYGTIGLVMAARSFRPERGGSFETIAWHRIRGEAARGLLRMAYPVVIPGRIGDKARESAARKWDDGMNHLLTTDRFWIVNDYRDPGSAARSPVSSALARMDPFRAEILRYAFGLEGRPRLNIAETAKAVGKVTGSVTASRKLAMDEIKSLLTEAP